MYNLILTPDYDFINKDIADIKKVIKSLSKILGKELNVILPKSYKEKIDAIKRIRPDIAYVNPILAQKLYTEGFIPFKLKKSHRLNLVILGKIKNEEDIIASLPYIDSYLLKNMSVNIAIVSDTFYESLPEEDKKKRQYT